jgi:hypothetical protein
MYYKLFGYQNNIRISFEFHAETLTQAIALANKLGSGWTLVKF